MRLITVFQAFSDAEAQLVRSRLDAADFNVHVAHELASINMEGYSMSTGGILIQVPEEEAEDALALVRSIRNPPDESIPVS